MTTDEPRDRAAITRAIASHAGTAPSATNVRAAGWVGRSKRSAAIWARTRGRALAYLLALTFFSTLTPHATARDITHADRTAITNVIKNWSDALQVGDFEAMAEIIPPRILHHMAARAEMDRSDLVAMTAKATAVAFKEITIEDFAFDMSMGISGSARDGSPYMFIPLQMIIKTAAGQRFTKISWPLALQDSGNWYLFEVEQQRSLSIFLDLFPLFAGIEVPAGSLKVLP